MQAESFEKPFAEEATEKNSLQQGPFAEAEAEKPVDLVELIYAPDWKTMLLDLVQGEKMDPWNIDVAELAGKYYAKIQSLSGTSLRIPANAMLCAAILLRFKAKRLRIASIEEIEDEMQKEENARNAKLFDAFEPALKNPRMLREGKVSLNDLVLAIEGIMEKTREKALKKKLSIPDFKIPFETENIEEKTEKVMELIANNADSKGLCLFSHLIIGKSVPEIVDTFVPVLFLCKNGKINAWQEEWFGEIFISLVKND